MYKQSNYEDHVAKKLNTLGYAFRRQVRIASPGGTLIIDFLLDRDNIALEIDGHEHRSRAQRAYDLWRDNYLQSMGYRTARITHKDIDTFRDAITHALLNATGTNDNSAQFDREDYVRLLKVYNVFVEAVSEFLLPDRMHSVQLIIQGYDRNGRSVNWQFNNSIDQLDDT